MNELKATRIRLDSLGFDRIGQVISAKKSTGDMHLCNKLIYLLKGGQLVKFIVTQICCGRVTTALKNNYFFLHHYIIFTNSPLLVLPLSFRYI